MSKLLTIVSILAISLSGCTAFRAIRCGTPSTETYTNFDLDTIHAADTIKTMLIDLPEHASMSV